MLFTQSKIIFLFGALQAWSTSRICLKCNSGSTLIIRSAVSLYSLGGFPFLLNTKCVKNDLEKNFWNRGLQAEASAFPSILILGRGSSSF
jgi:hypothetical protein